jgi:hypothetical protein
VTNKNKCTSEQQRNKIFGDSHARGCRAELLNSLGKNPEVMGVVMLDSSLEHITHLERSKSAASR